MQNAWMKVRTEVCSNRYSVLGVVLFQLVPAIITAYRTGDRRKPVPRARPLGVTRLSIFPSRKLVLSGRCSSLLWKILCCIKRSRVKPASKDCANVVDLRAIGFSILRTVACTIWLAFIFSFYLCETPYILLLPAYIFTLNNTKTFTLTIL